MKYFLVTIILSFIASGVHGQNIIHTGEVSADGEYENIHIKKLDTDENSTSFIIWVKEGVKSHKHVGHSEIIYVSEGEGKMAIGEKVFDIKAGDYFRIPKNTFHSLAVTSKTPMKVISVQAPEFFGKDRVFENEKKK